MGRSTWAGTVCAVLRAMLFSFTFSFLHQCCSHTISCSNHLRHGFNVFSFILFFFFNFIFIILLLFMFPFFRKIPNLKFMSNYFLISFFLFLLFIQKFSSAWWTLFKYMMNSIEIHDEHICNKRWTFLSISNEYFLNTWWTILKYTANRFDIQNKYFWKTRWIVLNINRHFKIHDKHIHDDRCLSYTMDMWACTPPASRIAQVRTHEFPM